MNKGEVFKEELAKRGRFLRKQTKDGFEHACHLLDAIVPACHKSFAFVPARNPGILRAINCTPLFLRAINCTPLLSPQTQVSRSTQPSVSDKVTPTAYNVRCSHSLKCSAHQRCMPTGTRTRTQKSTEPAKKGGFKVTLGSVKPRGLKTLKVKG